MIPGEPLPREDDIELNEGRETASITFANSGDRPPRSEPDRSAPFCTGRVLVVTHYPVRTALRFPFFSLRF